MPAPFHHEFIGAARKYFAYLQVEFGLAEKPLPRKPNNQFQVRYENESVLVIVEGIDWGHSVNVDLGPFENPLGSIEPAISFWPLLEMRRPDLFQLCRSTKGQLARLEQCAIALRECASDVLMGDLTILDSVARKMVNDARNK